MNHIKIVDEKINIEYIHSLIRDESCGASSVFVGTTRNIFDDKKVLLLEYEAYENMALKEMNKICFDLRMRWPDLKHIAIYHRVGVVPVCDASVVIGVSAPHRGSAIDSVAFAINQLKSRVPIWKKEIYENDPIGTWKENKEWQNDSEVSCEFFDFPSCQVEQKHNIIPETLIQILVNDSDLKKRIDLFIKRKRHEIDASNSNDFIQSSAACSSLLLPEDSCARTQSLLIKQENSKSHIKVRRAVYCNEPQTQSNYLLELNRLMNPENPKSKPKRNHNFLSARLSSIEAYMNAKSHGKMHILNRVKNVENRLLFLESVSPEYKHYIESIDRNNFVKKSGDKIFNPQKITEIIQHIKMNSYL